jgi:branched-chain amino acid transport system ATP-binding protein
VLRLEGITAGYGEQTVLFDVDLAVGAGERVALLGTNGAGKSTLLRVATGLLAPNAGRVVFDDVDITALPTDKRAAIGMSLIVGGRSTCPGLSVEENIRLGAWSQLRDRSGVAASLARVYDLFPALADRRDTAAGNLSGGEQQMMAIGRALMGNPKLLMIDELSLGLAPVVVGQVLDAVMAIADGGVTVLLVEQSLNVAASVCPRGVFLEKGEIRFDGAIKELLARGDLARAVFLGASPQPARRRRT